MCLGCYGALQNGKNVIMFTNKKRCLCTAHKKSMIHLKHQTGNKVYYPYDVALFGDDSDSQWLSSTSPFCKQWHTKLRSLCVCWYRQTQVMSDHKCTYSKTSVCVSPSWIEWRLCATSPSRGVLVLPVSKHPLDMEPSKGEQGPQCLPAPSALSWRRLPPWLPAP